MPKAPTLSFIKSKIKTATRLLYPRARAYRIPIGGVLDRLHNALAASEARLWQDSMLVLDAAIADNDNFTVDDAAAWEKRLGIASGGSAVSLSNRILAINRKINHPGTIKPRQNWRYVQDQLQKAGFNVFIYENKFSDGFGGYLTRTPDDLIGASFDSAYHDTAVEHISTVEHGEHYTNLVANKIDETIDSAFVIGGNYKSTFFIAGATVTTFANVDAVRKNEFRQLILHLKPAQTVAFLFINYV